MEAFSDNTVKIGKYGSEAIKVSGSVASVSGSFTGSFIGVHTGSLFGTASQALTASYLLGGVSAQVFPYSGSAQITGSLGVTGSLSVSGSMTIVGRSTATDLTGSLFGTSSWASNSISSSYAYTASSAISSSFANTSSVAYSGTGSFTGSFIGAHTGSLFGTASQALTASFLLGGVSAQAFPYSGSAQITGSLGVTGSINSTGNITTTGTLTAQTLVVQTITSSIEYSSGSNIFGSRLTDTQTFTGSMQVTGSATFIGNVGIGTSSPTAKLSVIDDNNTFSTHFSANNLSNGIAIGTLTGNYASIQGYTKTFSATSSISLQPNGGNVLIGATTGDGYRLQFVGTTQASSTFGQTYSGVAAYSQWVNSSGAFVMGLDSSNGSTERLRITSGGNVGIGTTSPAAKLNIAGNLGSTVGGGGSAIKMTNTDTGNYASIGAGIVGITNAGIQLSVDGTSMMVINGSGNVGIGTTSPGYKLVVAGDVQLGTGLNRSIIYDSSTGNFRITPDSGGWATGYFFNNYSGAFKGGFGAHGTGNTFTYYWIGGDYNTATMYITSGSSAAGNVGIGTTSPAYTLDVNGTGRFSGLISANNQLTIGNGASTSNSTLNFLGVVDTSYTWNITNDANGLSFISGYPLTPLKLNASTGAATFSGDIGWGGVIPTGNAGISNTIESSQGSQIAARQGFPQLYISSNVSGTPYAPTRKVAGYAAQLSLDALGGTITLNRAVSSTAGSAITWVSNLGFDNTGAATFVSSISATSATFSIISSDQANGGIIFIKTASANTGLITSTNQILGSGSTTDLNAYVYGSNSFGVWTNNSKRLTIDGGGAAIFSNSVTATDLIAASLNAGSPYNLTLGTSGADAGSVTMTAGSTSGYNTSIYVGGGASPTNPNSIVFKTASTTRLTIASTGAATFSNTVSATDYYFNSTSVERAVKRYVSTANVSNAGYTVVCNVTGNSLASAVRMTLQGTADSVVINVTADILVNHSQDILITSQAGIYTVLTLRVISDNNENFSVSVTSNSPNVCTMNVEVYPLNSEAVTFGGSAQTGTTLTHSCVPGLKISATGGSNGDFAALGNGTFGGGLTVTGSLAVTGSLGVTGSIGSALFSSNADSLVISGSLKLTGSFTQASNTNSSFAGSVLIGKTSGTGQKLEVQGAIYLSSTILVENTNIQYGLHTGNDGIQLTAGPGGVYLDYGMTSWGSLSDERFKNINSEILNATKSLKTLRTIKYSLKDDERNKINLGLIAQDVVKVFPEIVDIDNDEIGKMGIRYTELIPVLVKAIQELSTKLDEATTRINALESK
jgi:hypothetical protein